MSPPAQHISLDRPRRRASLGSGLISSEISTVRERSPLLRRASWPRVDAISPIEVELPSLLSSFTGDSSATKEDREEARPAALPPRPILKSALRSPDVSVRPQSRARGHVRFARSVLLREAAENDDMALVSQVLSSTEGEGEERCQHPKADPARFSTIGNRLDLNLRNHEGVTLLHLACFRGNVQMVQLLLRHGAEPNVVDFDGWTPLHAAANKKRMDIVVILVAAGAAVPPVHASDEMAGLASVTTDEDFIAHTRRLTDRKTALDAWRVLQAFL